MQETRVCRTTATHVEERRDALKAHVYPASMPAGAGSWVFLLLFSLNGHMITITQFTTRNSGFHGLTQYFN